MGNAGFTNAPPEGEVSYAAGEPAATGGIENFVIPLRESPMLNLGELGAIYPEGTLLGQTEGLQSEVSGRTNIVKNNQYSIFQNEITGERGYTVNPNLKPSTAQATYGNIQSDIYNYLGVNEAGRVVNLGKPGEVSFGKANPIPQSIQNAFGIIQEPGLAGTEVVSLKAMPAFTNSDVTVEALTNKGTIVRIKGSVQAIGSIFDYGTTPHAISTGAGKGLLEVTTQTPTLAARIGSWFNPDQLAGFVRPSITEGLYSAGDYGPEKINRPCKKCGIPAIKNGSRCK